MPQDKDYLRNVERAGKHGEILSPQARAVPDVIYHYTAMGNLLKIVESRQIWATEGRYLNDVTERDYCLSLIMSYLSHALESGHSNSRTLKYFFDRAPSQFSRYEEIYIASFSADRDSLAQWRAYCPHGNGVSIGFRTESLRRGAIAKRQSPSTLEDRGETSRPSVSSVLYLGTDDSDRIEDLVSLAEVAVRATEAIDIWTDQDARTFWTAMAETATLVKHPAFWTEREYRLVASVPFGSSATRYRSTQSMLTPYVAVDLPDPDGFLPTKATSVYPQGPYFIDSVTVGPSPNSALSVRAVRQLFASLRRDVDVHETTAPYRDW